MVLNGVQQSSLQAVWEYYCNSFEEVQLNNRNARLAFLASLITADPYQLSTDEETDELQMKMELIAEEGLGEAQLLIDMFRRPCPNTVPLVMQRVIRNLATPVFGNAEFGSRVLREREGIRCLTRDNMLRGQSNFSKPQSHDAYYPDQEAVSKRVVVMFLQPTVGQLVAKLRGLVLQEERVRIAELERELAATRDSLWQARADYGWQHVAPTRDRRHRVVAKVVSRRPSVAIDPPPVVARRPPMAREPPAIVQPIVQCDCITKRIHDVRVNLEFNKIEVTERQSKLSHVLSRILRYECASGCTLSDLFGRNMLQTHSFTCQEVFNVCEHRFNEKGPKFKVEEYRGDTWVSATNKRYKGAYNA